jgi:eukaryotic-like serine/threonine-protein kinase
MTPHRTNGATPPAAGTPRSPTRPHATGVALLLAMLTITTAVLTAGCVTVVKGNPSAPPAASRVTVIPPAPAPPSTPPGPTPVPTSQLPSLLVGLPGMRDLLAAPTLQPEQTSTELDDPDATANYEPPECISAVFTGMKNGYHGTDPLGAYGQSFKDPGDAAAHAADEMVVAFPDAGQAATAAAHLADQWRSCHTFGGTRFDEAPIPTFTFDPVTDSAGVSIQTRTAQGSRWACARYVSSQSNIVVEGQLCSYDIADRPQQIAHAILANIPQ